VDRAILDEVEFEYLYNEGDDFHFMNTKNYEQMQMSREELGETVYYLIPSTIVKVEFFEEKAIGVDLPDTMDMKVVQTEPTLQKAECALHIAGPLRAGEADLLLGGAQALQDVTRSPTPHWRATIWASRARLVVAPGSSRAANAAATGINMSASSSNSRPAARHSNGPSRGRGRCGPGISSACTSVRATSS